MIKKLKWWHLLVGTLLLVLISGLALHFYFKWSLANYKAELISKGEKLGFPYVVEGCEDKEAAAEIWKAYAGMPQLPAQATPKAMKAISPGKAQLVTKNHSLTPKEAEEWEGLDKFAAATPRTVLHQILAALEKECITVGLSFDNTKASAQSGHYRLLMQKLQLLTIWNLRNTNIVEAIQCATGFLNAVNGVKGEGALILELTRLGIASIGTSITWELLHHEVNDSNLIPLQAAWERQNWRSTIAVTERIERANLLTHFDGINSRKEFNDTVFWDGHSEVTEALADAGDKLFSEPKESFDHLSKATLIGNAYPYWVVLGQYFEIEGLLRNSQKRIEDVDKLKASDSVLDINLENRYPTPLLSYSITGHNIQKRYMESTAKAETQRDMVVAAIALYRYKKAHGQYPEKLEELAPAYLTKLPVDWFVAKPMQYRKRSDGTYLLYSVGVDLKDDGGQPGEKGGLFTQTGDMVWPWPATEEEIKRANQEKRK